VLQVSVECPQTVGGAHAQAKDVLAELDTKDAGSLVASAFNAARSHRKKKEGEEGPAPEPSRRSLRVTPGTNYSETFLCLPDDFDDRHLGKVRNLSLEVSKLGAEVSTWMPVLLCWREVTVVVAGTCQGSGCVRLHPASECAGRDHHSMFGNTGHRP
jgi:hypothetical protein